MSETQSFHVLPYSKIIGQEQIKLALELAYIAPRIGGVLLSGQRGTGKSTAVRAFANMVYGGLPITLPINATEDRVVGGWQIDELMRGNPTPQQGLLEDADGKILYVDEINLLDDHIVNILLDVTATGVLSIQREGRSETKDVNFTLVGTMNPEEGDLRPQLLDRFGLVVTVTSETDQEKRKQILKTVLDFDEARLTRPEIDPFIQEGLANDRKYNQRLRSAKENLYNIKVPEKITRLCISIAEKFQSIGHRGDYVMALAARALAARDGVKQVSPGHIRKVAQLALQHRRPNPELWAETDNQVIEEIVKDG